MKGSFGLAGLALGWLVLAAEQTPDLAALQREIEALHERLQAAQAAQKRRRRRLDDYMMQ